MMDYILNDHLSILAIITLIVVFVIYSLNENLFDFDGKNKRGQNKEADERNDDPLKDIFYQYNHKSEKEWAEWMQSQTTAVRSKALQLLKDHLEGPSKHWGYVTLEALSVLPHFKAEGAEHIASRFFMETGKLWGEYKSIPNYYAKAAEVMIQMNPQMALKFFSDEYSRRSNLQSELERKKIIIDACPSLGELGVGLMITIINNPKEVFAIRNAALRRSAKLDEESYKRVIIEALKFYIERLSNSDKASQENEVEILEDLFREGAKYIEENDILSVFDLACKSNEMIQRLALEPLITRVEIERDQLGIAEIYAMSLLRDNENQDLRKKLANIHELEDIEIANICMEAVREEPITEEILKKQSISESYLPIPKPFAQQYESFAKLFEPQVQVMPGNECQKAYGGVLITGDNDIEKLYFAKRFAKESSMSFAYINIADINNKDDYNRLINVFNELRKPYLLYIDHPELMYPSDKSQTANLRIKFGQTLYIQALDTKSYLVGSIKKRGKEIESETMLMAISQLRANFFAQLLEMNLEDDKFRAGIIEEYFRPISPHRQGERMTLAQQLYEQGKEQNCLEFAFLTLKILATMLLVYGRCMPLSNLDKLRSRIAIGKKG